MDNFKANVLQHRISGASLSTLRSADCIEFYVAVRRPKTFAEGDDQPLEQVGANFAA